MNGPKLQLLADAINYMCDDKRPLVQVSDNMESHLLALICTLANPNSIIVVPDSLKDSYAFFNMYDVFTVNTVPDTDYIEFGHSLMDGDKGTLAYHPLDTMSFEEVEQTYLDLEHSNLLPY